MSATVAIAVESPLVANPNDALLRRLQATLTQQRQEQSVRVIQQQIRSQSKES